MTTVKDGIGIFIEFSCCTNNQALTMFLEEKKETDWIKIRCEYQRTIITG